MTSPRAPVSGMCVSSLMVLKIGVLPDVRGSAALRETPSPLNHTLPFLAFSITSKWTPCRSSGRVDRGPSRDYSRTTRKRTQLWRRRSRK